MRTVVVCNEHKGLTSRQEWGIFPLGKKGTVKTYAVTENVSTDVEYGATIKDGDRRNIITTLSMAIKSVGFDRINKVIEKPLDIFDDDTMQPLFTPFIVKASELSVLLYKTTREGRQVAKSLKAASQMMLTIHTEKKQNFMSLPQVQNIVYKDGMISFSIYNGLINHLIQNRLPFRIAKTLLYLGFTYRLSFYIETNQYPKNGNWFPKNTYSLDELLDGLTIRNMYEGREDKLVQKIQEAFNELHSIDSDFPQYKYDKIKKFFYNKYKKGDTLGL